MTIHTPDQDIQATTKEPRLLDETHTHAMGNTVVLAEIGSELLTDTAAETKRTPAQIDDEFASLLVQLDYDTQQRAIQTVVSTQSRLHDNTHYRAMEQTIELIKELLTSQRDEAALPVEQ